jgi:hypothetical protein
VLDIERLYQNGQTGSFERVKGLIYAFTHRSSIPVSYPSPTHDAHQQPSYAGSTHSNIQHKTATTTLVSSNLMSTGKGLNMN